jgi:hypothetical protein
MHRSAAVMRLCKRHRLRRIDVAEASTSAAGEHLDRESVWDPRQRSDPVRHPLEHARRRAGGVPWSYVALELHTVRAWELRASALVGAALTGLRGWLSTASVDPGEQEASISIPERFSPGAAGECIGVALLRVWPG